MPSASSFGTDSFIILGALSTNFFESTKLNPSSALISLMTLGFAPASNDISFTLNRVFSCAAGAASSSTSAGAAAGAAGPAANPPTGRSGMLSRDCEETTISQSPSFQHHVNPYRVPTFKLVTRSAVSSSVNWLIWSTMPAILGFVDAASVDWCRRPLLCWAMTLALVRREDLERIWRVQHDAAYLQESDMAGRRVSRTSRGAGGRCCVA